MGALGLDNIWGEQDVENLFTNTDETSVEEVEETDGNPSEEKEPEETTEVNPEELFEEEEDKEKDTPESVGSGKEEEDTQGKEDPSPETGDGTSPDNFYSSIALAMAEDGIFPNLDEETIKKAETAEGLSDLIEAEVNARLDDKQQRIAKALENGVEPTNVQKYETVLNNLSRLTDKVISEESEKGEQLRRDLIYQDFINRGYKPDIAQKKTERIIDSGTDVEDAKEALQSNREYFQKQYDELLKEAEANAEAEKATRQKEAEKLKASILKDKDLMGDMEIGGDMRKKVFENISKPVYKDPETGIYMTAIQKYEAEHRAEFLKYAGLFYTLTNGFKDFKTFTKGEVKKGVKKGLSQLEKILSNTKRDSGGNLKLRTTVSEDPESYIGKGWKLDI